jgi:hypothetical protein
VADKQRPIAFALVAQPILCLFQHILAVVFSPLLVPGWRFVFTRLLGSFFLSNDLPDFLFIGHVVFAPPCGILIFRSGA